MNLFLPSDTPGWQPELPAWQKPTMQVSARNVLKGRIAQITPGTVETEVVLELAPGLSIVATITKASAERMSLRVGAQAAAIIKASSVIVAVD